MNATEPAVSSSAAVGSLIEIDGGVSSFVIVTVATLSAAAALPRSSLVSSVPLTGLLSVTVNASSTSSVVSPVASTVMV